MIDATGLLVLPGAVDVHTHTRVATDERPDRFFEDSVAAAFGGTTSFLAFNNPGTGSSPAGGALAADRARASGCAATNGDSAIDYGLSLAISGHADDSARRAARDRSRPGSRPRRRSWSSTSGWATRRCSTRCGSWASAAGCSRSTARIRSCSTPGSRARFSVVTWHRATTLQRDHPTWRRWRRRGPSAFARMTDAPLHVVHLSSAAALDEVRRGKAAGVRVTAETCPHYLDPHRGAAYDEPDPTRCACFVISPPLRSAADRDALWAGLADGTLDLVATDHVPDRLGVEKAEAGARRLVRSDQQRRPRDRDPAHAASTAKAWRRGRITRRADGRPHRHDPGGALRARPQGRPGGRPRRRHRRLRSRRRAHDPRRGPPPLERLHARTRASRCAAPSATSSCAAPTSIRDGALRRPAGRRRVRGARHDRRLTRPPTDVSAGRPVRGPTRSAILTGIGGRSGRQPGGHDDRAGSDRTVGGDRTTGGTGRRARVGRGRRGRRRHERDRDGTDPHGSTTRATSRDGGAGRPAASCWRWCSPCPRWWRPTTCSPTSPRRAASTTSSTS